jgi:hypothetical protein
VNRRRTRLQVERVQLYTMAHDNWNLIAKLMPFEDRLEAAVLVPE